MVGISTPCREWRCANIDGYGVRWDRERKKVVLLHRWVVAQIDGWDAIEDKEVMHLCDNPACYRYDHLQIGTRSDNMQDAMNKGRLRGLFKAQNATHCRHGHLYDEANTYIDPRGKRQCRRCRADASARCAARS